MGEKENFMFEYVTKAEYQPVREELEKIIIGVQEVMRKNYATTFQFRLIGSGKRHLITRVVNGNGGYDFDYNLIIPAPEEGYSYKADVVKQHFMEAFKIALSGTKYSNPQDSTSAITIKVIDSNNKIIEHSCDFAIIYYDKNREENGYYYLRNDKNQRKYSFVFRTLSRSIDYKLNAIMEYENGWSWVREEYIKIKNSNRDIDKHSFVLYLEAISNVLNQINQQEESVQMIMIGKMVIENFA
jgi:hypothetical protein